LYMHDFQPPNDDILRILFITRKFGISY